VLHEISASVKGQSVNLMLSSPWSNKKKTLFIISLP